MCEKQVIKIKILNHCYCYLDPDLDNLFNYVLVTGVSMLIINYSSQLTLFRIIK